LTVGSFARSTVPLIGATPLPLAAICTGLLSARLLSGDRAPYDAKRGDEEDETEDGAGGDPPGGGRRTRMAPSFLSLRDFSAWMATM